MIGSPAMGAVRVKAGELRVRAEWITLALGLLVLFALFLFVLRITLGAVLLLVGVFAVWVKVRQGQLLGLSVRVTAAQLPEVHRVAQLAADRLGMPIPDLFVTQNPVINAYALGFFGRKSVVLHSATVEAMTPEELCSVIGHEFTHIKCDHTSWLVFTNLKDAVRIPFVSDLAGLILLAWSRNAEYTADRGGLVACRDLPATVSALAKVAVGPDLFQQLDLDAFFAQRDAVGRDDVSRLAESLSTHPYVVNRISALRRFAGSSRYRDLSTRSA